MHRSNSDRQSVDRQGNGIKTDVNSLSASGKTEPNLSIRVDSSVTFYIDQSRLLNCFVTRCQMSFTVTSHQLL